MRRTSVFLSETAQRILRHLHPNLKRSVRQTLDDLASDPFLGKPLQDELTGLWSLPVGRYRLIYQVSETSIAVVFLGPRRTVYARLRELLTERMGTN
jgi:mRNA-degrading endonuclease RelE of RelBE toxin-antitoxin system